MTGGDNPDWPDDVFRALRALEVRQVAYVPDAGLARLIEACERDEAMRAIPLASEQEGVALTAGAWLGGQRGVLMMQSSGVGNCLNAFALTRTCRLPLLMLVTMRGEAIERNPWQNHMGEVCADALRLAEIAVHPVDRPAQAGSAVEAAGRAAFADETAHAVLVAQAMIGVKNFDKSDAAA
ncbi:MAG: thiamine pyrophosphate-binding protein [Alphaproteobacteria bacterium]